MIGNRGGWTGWSRARGNPFRRRRRPLSAFCCAKVTCVKVTDEYAEWFRRLIKEDLGSATQVAQAVAALREPGPTLGRPLVDRLKGSELHHLKELRPGSGGRSEIRIVFAFDPTRSALLLLGGDKAGNRDAGTATTFRWLNSSTATTPATRRIEE